MTIAPLGLKVKVIGQGQRSKVNVQRVWAWWRSNAVGLTSILDRGPLIYCLFVAGTTNRFATTTYFRSINRTAYCTAFTSARAIGGTRCIVCSTITTIIRLSASRAQRTCCWSNRFSRGPRTWPRTANPHASSYDPLVTRTLGTSLLCLYYSPPLACLSPNIMTFWVILLTNG